MKRLTFLLLLVSSVAYAQEENVFLTRKVKKGIYYTYHQFLTNSPGETEDFESRPVENSYFYLPGSVVSVVSLYPNQTGSDTTGLMYMLYDSTKKKKKIKNAYAYCDGQNVFINSATYQNHSDYYLKVLDLGRILYTRDPIMNQATAAGTGGMIGGLIGGAIGTISANKRSRGVIIFYEDEGVPYILNKKTMTAILSVHDPKLYRQYQEEDMNDEAVLEKYILLFNQKHP